MISLARNIYILRIQIAARFFFFLFGPFYFSFLCVVKLIIGNDNDFIDRNIDNIYNKIDNDNSNHKYNQDIDNVNNTNGDVDNNDENNEYTDNDDDRWIDDVNNIDNDNDTTSASNTTIKYQ